MATVSTSKPTRLAPPPGSTEHEESLKYVVGRVREAEDGWHTQMCRQMNENYRAFRAWKLKGDAVKLDWQTDLRNPYIHEQIFTLLPRLIDPRPQFDYYPTAPTPYKNVRATERVNEWFMWKDNFTVRQIHLMLITALFGVGWTQQGWLYNSRRRCFRNPVEDVMLRGKPLVEERRVRVDDRPTSDVMHPFDTIWDNSAPEFSKCDWVCTRHFVSVEQVKAKARVKTDDGWVGIYENTDKVRGSSRGREFYEELPNRWPIEHENRRQKQVEVLTFWSRSRDRKIVVADRQIVLQDIRNPFYHCDIPLSCVITQPDVMRIRGISEVEPLIPTQTMLHMIENQRMDNSRIGMDIILLIRDGVQDSNNWAMGPGARWIVSNTDGDVKPLALPTPQLVGMEEARDLRGKMQSISGITPYQTGADATAMGVNQETASGLMAIQEEANKRIELRLTLARCLGYERIASQFLANTQQFMTQPELVRIGGRTSEDFQWHSKEDIAGGYFVRSRQVSELMNKQMRTSNATMLLSALQGMLGTPLPDGKVPNPTPAFEMLADALDRDPADFMMDKPAEQVAQEQAQLLQMVGGGAPSVQQGMMPSTQPQPGSPANAISPRSQPEF